MIGLSALTKMAKGTLGPDEIAELLNSMGFEASMKELPIAAESFVEIGSALSLPHAKLIGFTGRNLKTGERFHAVLVVTAPSDSGHSTENSQARKAVQVA